MRLLLSGYYGFGNLGDEALLRVISARLKARRPGDAIEALTADPEGAALAYAVEATARGDLRAVRAAIGRADVLLSGGGGLLQNATSLRSLLYYAGVIRTAIKAGKRAMIFAQSIGPLDFWGKRVVRECCRGLAAATVRDARSRDVLAPLLPDVAIEVTADPVFLYEPPAATPPAANAAPYDAVFCVRDTARFALGVPALAAAADRLAERGARIAFVSFAGEDDARAARAVIGASRTKPALVPATDLDRTAALIAGARVVVGVRLHALILAARFGVPFLAVPYDPKIAGLCDDLAYPLAPLWTPGGARISAATAAERADELWERRDELAAHLARRLPDLAARAERNFAALDALVA